MIDLDSPVSGVKSVGEKTAQRLFKLGIVRLRDFLTFFPRTYEDRSQTVDIADAAGLDGKICVRGMIRGCPSAVRLRGGKTMVKAVVCDDTGALEIVFFNQPYVKDALKPGTEYLFFGSVEQKGGRRTMVSPIYEEVGKNRKLGNLTAIYHGTQGLTQTVIQTGVAEALKAAAGRYIEILPPGIVAKYRLCPPEYAYGAIHCPQSWEDVKQAKRRLIFEELFLFCLATQSMGKREKRAGVSIPACDISAFYKTLPFVPTGAQKRAVNDALTDMQSGERMNRLLQGDVGSGKTLVAAACAYAATQNGGQAVIMAPTEILAAQHFATMQKLFAPFSIECAYLASDMTAAEKKNTKKRIRSGEVQVICGTHALISQDVAYKKACLFVVDEQHRFGVRQRAALSEKAGDAHFMVMSATPIPRTLTLLLYGDLSVSVLDERPPGRLPVRTYVVPEEKRSGMYGMIRDLAKEGGQTYIVCPLIDENEALDDRKAAATYAEELSAAVPGLRVGLMHGRLKAAEKDAVMGQFSRGELDVLVSTTVIEVGTDVPNARIMVVENADLFGLSQLHQLRGRVGRGSGQAYCFLMSRGSSSGRERLQAMCKTDDGFKIAEEDLRLRGPGDFLGDRQHGSPEFAIADLATDMQILNCARQEAEALFKSDPGLENHPHLRERVETLISEKGATFN